MNKQLPLLLVLTLVVVTGALYVYNQKEPVQSLEKTSLLPQLKAVINDVNELQVQGNGHTVTLNKTGEHWVLSSHDNYPALFNVVKSLIIQLSELMILAQKTDNPELYSRLGVEDPEQGLDSILLTIKTSSDERFSLIVGKKKFNQTALPSLYVRIPGQPHALRVEGSVNIQANSDFWFDNTLADIASESIQEVAITHPGEDMISLVRSEKGDAHFELVNVPDDREVVSEVVLNRMGRMLEGLQAVDVRKFSGDEKQMVTTQLSTFDGLQITLRLTEIDGKPFVNLSYGIIDTERDEETEKEIQERVSTLNQKHADWFYQIQDFKYKDMTIDIEQLLQPVS